MKASLKFREDEKPLLKAKIPINILGFPFQSGISAGDSKELSLQLGTNFESGPSLKFAYRPNDVWNPFSFVVKTGIGAFGSTKSSSMLMSAEFNLVGNGNPSFFLRFKPRFGDFSIKKSQSSNFVKNTIGSESKVNGAFVHVDESVEVMDSPVMNRMFPGEKIALMQPISTVSGIVNEFFSGVEVNATTCFPVTDRAAMKLRWGVCFPTQLRDVLKDEGLGKKRMAGIAFHKLPLLVMDKISIEHVYGTNENESKSPVNADVAELYVSVKQQLEFLKAENGLLRKSVENLRSDLSAGNAFIPTSAPDSCKKKLSGDIKGRSSETKISEFNENGEKGSHSK